MSQPKIGKAKFGGDFVKKIYWKLKDGESTFRILPPIGDEACESGRWSQYWEIHYGYKNSQGQMRVFVSPLVKNRKTKMVEVPDAALERIEVLKAKQAKMKAEGDNAGFEKVGGLLQQYNLDKNHYVNAMDEQGNIGLLKLRYRCKQALDVTIKELRDKGIDPLDVETGRFFNFRRSGNGLDTTFKVTVKQRELNVPGVGLVNQDIVHVLDESILARLGKEASDLNNLFKRPTSEEVARIVKESDLLSGKSRAVDEILDSKQRSSAAQSNEGSDEDCGDDNEAPQASSHPLAQPFVVAPNAVSSIPAVGGHSSPAPTPLMAPAFAEGKVTTATFTAPKAEKTTAQSIAETTDEDFLKSLGV